MAYFELAVPRLLLLCNILIFTVGASAADPGKAISPCLAPLAIPGDEVVARLMAQNGERATKLLHVDSVRHYNLDYTGFPSALHAQMEVKVSYRSPGNKTFTVVSESGSGIIRNRVFHKLLDSEQEASADAANRDAVMLSTSNYRFALLGCQDNDGPPLYVLRVEPLRTTKFLYRGTIWVDPLDYAVTRIEAEPAKKPSFWTTRSQIHHQYQKIGEFYLPVLNKTVTDVRLGGKAVLTIQYLDYTFPAQAASAASSP